MSASAVTADAWLERDERDWRDPKFQVLGSKFRKPRTSNLEFVARHMDPIDS